MDHWGLVFDLGAMVALGHLFLITTEFVSFEGPGQ